MSQSHFCKRKTMYTISAQLFENRSQPGQATAPTLQATERGFQASSWLCKSPLQSWIIFIG